MFLIGRRRKNKLDDIRKCWAKIKEEEFDFDQIRKYHDRKDEAEYLQVLSEKVCNDLDFEDLFRFLDRTTSKVGQQCLYHRLRCIPKDSNKTKELEELVAFYDHNEDKRWRTVSNLNRLNDQEVYYLSNLFQEATIDRPKWFFIVPLLSITNVIALLLSFIMPSYLLLVLGVTVVNLIIHYWNKWFLFDYQSSIPQLFRMCQVAKRIMSEKLPGEEHSLKSALNRLDGIRKRFILLKMEMGIQDDLKAGVTGILEIVKIIFLLDPLMFFGVLAKIEKNRADIEHVFEYIGRVDAALSILALRIGLSSYCHPEIVDARKVLESEGCYHPLIKDPVANSLKLNNQSLLLTGSNMSGKTTFIRALGINALTALTINTCFADRFMLPRLKIWSAIRISDDLLSDRSYYFEEVLTIKEMIHQAESSTTNLYLLDEIYKGTNTIERISGGKAVLSYLNRHENIVFVSTHDVELTQLLKDEYKLHHFTECVKDGDILFDYQLKEGPLKTRNAIKILEVNDYPKDLVAEAKAIGKCLEA